MEEAIEKEATSGVTTEKGGRLAARRSSRSVETFWEESRLLSSAKVKRILEKRGFDPNAFARDYLEDRSRAPRGANRAPTKAQIDAVKAFLKEGDVEQLKERLRVKTPAAALNVVAAVNKYLSEGGVVAIRRAKSS